MIAKNSVVDKCASTNDLANTLGEQGVPHGSWISSRIQETGRGRLGRRWQSIEGNLFLSLIARVEDKRLWSWVPLTTAVGVVHYLRNKFPVLEVQVKWPNDIYLRDRKLGGILCESAGGADPYIIIGLGLNCVASPDEPDFSATNLTTLLNGQKITADDIRLDLIAAIMNELNRLVAEGPKNIKSYYQKWAVLSPGTKIKWNQGQKSGHIDDLGPSGELEVLTDEGVRLSLFAEDISLDKK